jgi:cytochrome c-type biogenesis protein CcmH
MNALRALVAGLLLAVSAGSGAIVFEQREFDDAEQLDRYKTLIYELRCLVCQNQNLADSDADLAGDLRNEVYRMIREGKTNEDVVDFMVARYGDFVLFRPPFNAKTVALWVAPFILALGGLVLLVAHLRRRPAAQPTVADLSDEERGRLRSLLDSDRDG